MEPFSALLALCAGNSPHKGQWRGALMCSLICAWINDWVNNREAGDLRRLRGHYDVNVMLTFKVATPGRLETVWYDALSLCEQRSEVLHWIPTLLIASRNSGLVIWVTACGDYTSMVHYIPADPSVSHLVVQGRCWVLVIHHPTEKWKSAAKVPSNLATSWWSFRQLSSGNQNFEKSIYLHQSWFWYNVHNVFDHTLTSVCPRTPIHKCEKQNNVTCMTLIRADISFANINML